jgi:hypothetical protein
MFVYVGLLENIDVLEGLLYFPNQASSTASQHSISSMSTPNGHSLQASLHVCAVRKQTVDISSSDVQLYDRVFWDMTGICHVSFPDLQHT